MKKPNLIKNFPYPQLRPLQKEVLEKLENNWDKLRYIVLELPTGIGKSAIAQAVCNSHNNAFLVTATKQLQDQYIQDFPHEDLVSIKGKTNYKCIYGDRLSCEHGPCIVNKGLLKDCRTRQSCPYYTQRDEALNANTCLTSYQYFLRAMDTINFWKPRDVLILDECHLLERQITQWASTFLSPTELHLQYKIFDDIDPQIFMAYSVAPETSGYEANKNWLKKIWDLISIKRMTLYKAIAASSSNGILPSDPNSLNEDSLDELAATHAEYYELDRYYRRLDVFFKLSDAEKDNWLIEPQDDGIMMTPVNINNLFSYHMDQWGKDKIIFMSATILDIPGFCKDLGLPKEKTAIIKADSTFDPTKSPIISYPTGSMSYNALDTTIPKILENVKKILDQHPNEKGVIHTGNYRIAKAICDGINDQRLIMKDDKSNNEKLLKKHIKSNIPTVLVSPSLTTGADLKDDLGRFQIVIKLPWISLQDKRVQKKIQIDDKWYASEMFRTLVQACGRSTRSEEDWSITYILDSAFYYWVNKYKNWFSKQFLKRIVWNKDKFNINKFKQKIEN